LAANFGLYVELYKFALQTSKSIQNTTIFTSAWQWTTKQFNTKGCKLLSVCGLFYLEFFLEVFYIIMLGRQFLKRRKLLDLLFLLAANS